MKIILPPHKKQSRPVHEITGELKSDIAGMEKLVRLNNFENNRGGYAVAHCQVSENPYRIFVAREGVLPTSVVINPKIIEKSEPFTAKECCLSFPFRPFTNVKRFYNIKVSYLDRHMQEQEDSFEGVQAQIFQHEIQHFNGQNIYNF